MKLRNRKTGEIIDLDEWSFDTYNNMFCIARGDAEGDNIEYFKSFADFNSKYEDYEEPKVAYFIDAQGDVCKFSDTDADDWSKEAQIGNYFKTQEEAEKAVEKLEAWKRLKDKGFRFSGYHIVAGEIHFDITISREILDDFNEDMDICFGGEE